jgi:hypothetical protein
MVKEETELKRRRGRSRGREAAWFARFLTMASFSAISFQNLIVHPKNYSYFGAT